MIHNAYNPRAISLHYGNNRKNPWLNIGIDCYYSLTGQLGIREGTYFCDYGAEYASNFLAKAPWVIEQESGYWKDYPQVYGPELYLWTFGRSRRATGGLICSCSPDVRTARYGLVRYRP